jgi:phosphoribosylamine--glycine ligase / phosphoribosylformylglycinamidine cyclo-ligase
VRRLPMADGAAYLEAHKVPDAITAAVTKVLKTRPADPITAIGELLIKRQKSMVTVMVVGSGGREMAQSLKLAQSDVVDKVLVAPGNGGTSSCHPKISNLADVKDSDILGLVAAAKQHGVALVAIGPEGPLVAGIADALAAENIPCFGPTKMAAELENSKAWMKEFFTRHGLPTARHVTFTEFAAAKAHVESIDYPVVVKCSGLAGGKGVLMPTTKEETIDALKQVMVDKVFGSAGDQCVVEECLYGPECSVLAFCDGTTAVCMPGAQDHKRALDGDQGLNTGGMGAYARCPCLTKELEEEAAAIIQRTVTALASEGRKYVGVLFAGLMLTKDGPKLLEYNCRMGDPETQVVLPLLDSDLYLIMKACTEGDLASTEIKWSSQSAATVVMAAAGYPGTYAKGAPILGLEVAGAMEGVTVYHAGTKVAGGGIVCNGGRVLAVTGVGANLRDAVGKAYAAVHAIKFDCKEGAMFRTDIAAKAFA